MFRQLELTRDLVDQELSAKIESELQLEKEMRDSEKLPSTLQDYLDSSSFEVSIPNPQFTQPILKIHSSTTPQAKKKSSSPANSATNRKPPDPPSSLQIPPPSNILSPSPPSLRVSFSIADLNAMDQDPDDYRQDPNESQDPALYDEDIPESAQSGGANTKGAINYGHTKGGNINIAPEDRIAPADREELADDESPAPPGEDDEPGFPARVNVMIEKVGKGTLQIETTAEDGQFVIDNVFFFKDAELADAKTAELDWKRRNLYEGPPFGNLDEELQVLLEKYLDERGVNTALAVWVPEYIDFKEQREYLDWLSSKSNVRPSSDISRPLTRLCRCEIVRGCIGTA